MPNKASISDKLIALLDNAKTLAIRHQQRPLAVDVVRACKILAQNKGSPVAPELFDPLIEGIPGKMVQTLVELFTKTANTIIASSKSANRKSKTELH